MEAYFETVFALIMLGVSLVGLFFAGIAMMFFA